MVKEQFRIGHPLDVSILDRKFLSRTRSYESTTGQMSLHKGNILLEAKRSRCVHVGEQIACTKQMSSSIEATDTH